MSGVTGQLAFAAAMAVCLPFLLLVIPCLVHVRRSTQLPQPPRTTKPTAMAARLPLLLLAVPCLAPLPPPPRTTRPLCHRGRPVGVGTRRGGRGVEQPYLFY